jgi:dihydrolipoamide dehydrogenase
MLLKMGVVVGKPKLDLPTMLKFKDDGVDGNVKGERSCSRRTRLIPMSDWQDSRRRQGRGEGR